MDQGKFFKGCLPQILLGPLFNTWFILAPIPLHMKRIFIISSYGVDLVSLMLTLNILNTLFYCFYCWLWTGKCRLGIYAKTLISEVCNLYGNLLVIFLTFANSTWSIKSFSKTEALILYLSTCLLLIKMCSFKFWCHL